MIDIAAKRVASYAGKWQAEHQYAEPPVQGEPTDEALEVCFAKCARPAPRDMYDAIRLAIKGDCGNV